MRGARPGLASEPNIVNVLPAPVCPYVSRLPLKPPRTASAIGSPTASKRSCCDDDGPKTRSKAKVRGSDGRWTSALVVDHGCTPTDVECAGGGRMRTATWMRSAAGPGAPRPSARRVARAAGAVDGRAGWVDLRGVCIDARSVRGVSDASAAAQFDRESEARAALSSESS